MVRAPIRIPLDHYRGRDEGNRRRASRRNDIAWRLQEHINSNVSADGQATFIYREIAVDLGLDPELVHELLYDLDGGDNGIIVCGEHWVDPSPPSATRDGSD
jgi:hypothetical protein